MVADAPAPDAADDAGIAVGLTGVSGYLGQRVLAILDADPRVARIVGIDLVEPARRGRKLTFHRLDVTSGELGVCFEGLDVVVHLAAMISPLEEDLFERVNVVGTERVLAAMDKAGVPRIVRASSAALYGPRPGATTAVDEHAPLRPAAGFFPAEHDLRCERMIEEWVADARRRRAARLRMAPVVGPGAPSVFARLVLDRPPVALKTWGPVQVIHADDAAAAIAHAALEDLDGVYNVAADGWIDAEESTHLLPGRRIPGLGPELAERTLRAMWTTGVVDLPPSAIGYMQHGWMIDNAKLRATGWEPRHANDEAIVLSLPADGVSRTLPWAAAVAAVVAGAAGATWWLSRRNRH